MNKTYYLTLVASKLENKYAQGQSIQEAVESAADRNLGILNFPAQLKKDQATLSFTVIKAGSTFLVSEPVVNPPDVAQNYVGLAGQVKRYLEKYYQYIDDQTFKFQYP